MSAFIGLVNKVGKYLGFVPAEGAEGLVSGGKMGFQLFNPIIRSISGKDEGDTFALGAVIPANKLVELNFGTIKTSTQELLVGISPAILKTAIVNNPGVLRSHMVVPEDFSVTMLTVRQTVIPRDTVILTLYVID